MAQRQARGRVPQWLRHDGRATGQAEQILRFLQRRAPHQALKNQTPDAVHHSATGGGTMILDKYGTNEGLPIALRSTGLRSMKSD